MSTVISREVMLQTMRMQDGILRLYFKFRGLTSNENIAIKQNANNPLNTGNAGIHETVKAQGVAVFALGTLLANPLWFGALGAGPAVRGASGSVLPRHCGGACERLCLHPEPGPAPPPPWGHIFLPHLGFFSAAEVLV